MHDIQTYICIRAKYVSMNAYVIYMKNLGDVLKLESAKMVYFLKNMFILVGTKTRSHNTLCSENNVSPVYSHQIEMGGVWH